MNTLATLIRLLITVALLASCRSRTEETPAHEAAGHSEDSLVVPLAGLRGILWITAPEPRAAGAWYPGEAISDESAQNVLTSPVGGVVAEAPRPPQRPVRGGAELLVINSPEQAELVSRWLIAREDAEQAHASLRREERLFTGGATSQSELEAVRRRASVAEVVAASAHLGLTVRGVPESERSGRFVLHAPADGAVVRWNVRSGQGIAAGQELGLFQTASARLVRVDLTLPGPGWRIADETEVRSSDGRGWKARVVGVPSILGEDTRRLAFRLELTDGTLPLPGQPVEVRVPYAAAVILPQSAVQQIEGIWGVFLRSGDNARFCPIKRGVELGSDVVIEEGVAPGSEVVTDGAYLLKSLWLKGRSGGDAHDD